MFTPFLMFCAINVSGLIIVTCDNVLVLSGGEITRFPLAMLSSSETSTSSFPVVVSSPTTPPILTPCFMFEGIRVAGFLTMAFSIVILASGKIVWSPSTIKSETSFVCFVKVFSTVTTLLLALFSTPFTIVLTVTACVPSLKLLQPLN